MTERKKTLRVRFSYVIQSISLMLMSTGFSSGMTKKVAALFVCSGAVGAVSAIGLAMQRKQGRQA